MEGSEISKTAGVSRAELLRFLNAETSGKDSREDRIRFQLRSCVELIRMFKKRGRLSLYQTLNAWLIPELEGCRLRVNLRFDARTGQRDLVYFTDTAWGNYILAFLKTIAEVGAERVFRCEWCGTIQTGRTNQRFCKGSKCRSMFHNSKRTPEEIRESVRKTRESRKMREEARRRLRKR